MAFQDGVWTVCISLMCCSIVAASHFRGGTISWKGTGNGNEVQFNFKMGWTYGAGPGCTSALVGQFVARMSNTTGWTCISGCPTKTFLASVNYYCTAASVTQKWEQGENSFTYTFPSQGPFLIQFTGNAWMALSYTEGSGLRWNLTTVVDLRPRSDTGNPNQSPVAASKPLYNVKYGCESVIRLPMLDADGDRIRCRWAVGYECAGACNAMPNTILDQNTCALNVKATHTSNGWFAVAIVVEDLPRTTITRGGQTFTPNDVISSTPLQFIVHTPPIPSRKCTDKPVFVTPTPSEGDTIAVPAGDTLRTSFYSTSPGSSVTSFALTAPPGVSQSAVYAVVGRPGVYVIDVTWTPTAANKGAQALCAEATDAYGISSESHCLTIVAWDIDPCDSGPCQHGGTCTRTGYSDQFTCSCSPGFTGTLCEIDIDECASAPCQNNATCIDQVNQFFCGCRDGFTGTLCEIDIDDCAPSPCLNGGTCTDVVAGFVCGCVPSFTGDLCQTGLDHCASLPCLNGGQCYSNVTGYFCHCVSPWEGRNCGFRKVYSQNMKTYSHSQYSNCDCMEERHADEACDDYKTSRGVGFGFLGSFLGFLTVIGLYAVSEIFMQPSQGRSLATRALERLRMKSMVSPSPDPVSTGRLRRTQSWHPSRGENTSQLSTDEDLGDDESNAERNTGETGPQSLDAEENPTDRIAEEDPHGAKSSGGLPSGARQRSMDVSPNGPAKPVFRVSLLTE